MISKEVPRHALVAGHHDNFGAADPQAADRQLSDTEHDQTHRILASPARNPDHRCGMSKM